MPLQRSARSTGSMTNNQQQSERNAIWMPQNADLRRRSTPWTQVIRKIDKGKRVTFQGDFDKITHGCRIVFPKCFWRGHAYLGAHRRLICSIRVTIMARPPGKKKYSTIHLLSGGEKAPDRYRVGVFHSSAHRLLLHAGRVDARLDDANARRYARIVKAIRSECNSFTLRMKQDCDGNGDHYFGVTMHEHRLFPLGHSRRGTGGSASGSVKACAGKC